MHDVIMTKPNLNIPYILTVGTETKVKVGRFVYHFAFAFLPTQDPTPRTISGHPFTNRGI